MSSEIAAFVCWACIALVAFAYLGYPLLIFALSRSFGRPQACVGNRSVGQDGACASGDVALPFLSLLIAAHDEERDIEARILDALAIDYPADKLEIVIASDGSTDRTEDIVRRFADRGVRLLAYSANRGKAAVLNASIPQLAGEIVLLSDANTRLEADAARCLAAWFTDPSVGVVCGRLVLADSRSGKNVDGLYWRYETFLKKCESRLGALLGSNGAIYAIRKALFPGIASGTIIDDFVIPLEAKRRSGCRIVYDTAAVAYEETAPTIGSEFRRRVRIGAGGFQSICLLWPLLSPANGWVAFAFLNHKVLRWACPFFLLGALGTNALLLGTPLYDGVMVTQVGFYLLAAGGHWLPRRPRCLRVLRLPTMFVAMNAALFLGFFRWLAGRQGGTWRRTDRASEAGTGRPEPFLVGIDGPTCRLRCPEAGDARVGGAACSG